MDKEHYNDMKLLDARYHSIWSIAIVRVLALLTRAARGLVERRITKVPHVHRSCSRAVHVELIHMVAEYEDSAYST